MGEKGKYLFKNMGILTISNFASKILVFLLVPLYTSVLSTTEYGTYDLIVSTVSLVYPILTMNIFDAVMRYCMDKSVSKNDIAVIGSKNVVSGILLGGVALLIMGSFHLIPEIEGLELLIFLYYVSSVINQFFVQFAKGLEKVALMGLVGAVGTVVMLGGNILFLLVFKMGLKGFFIANILAQAIPALLYFFGIRFWKYVKSVRTDRKLEKQMLAYCLPLLFTTLGWWINNAADRYTVTLICGVAANGILSVAYKIPSIINTLQSIFIQAWQISAIKEYGEKETSAFYGKTFLALNFFMTFSCAVLILLSKPLAYVLYAKDFFVAWKYVSFLMISTVFNCSSGFIGPILAAKKDSKSMALSSIYGTIVNVVLNIALVFLWGIQGATIATAVSSYVIYYFRFRAIKSELEVEHYWKQLTGWALLIVESIVNCYYHNLLLELGIVILVLILDFSVVKRMWNNVWRIMKKIMTAVFRRVKWYCYTLFMYVCRICPVNTRKVLFMNFFGKGYGDNAKYICEYLRSCGDKLKLVWVVSDMKAVLPDGVKKVRYMSLRYFFELSTAKVWVDNCRKQPYIKKRRKQFYIQTWHGDIGPKKVEGEVLNTLYASYVKSAKKDSRMADLCVSGNRAFSERYRTAFWYEGKIAECGYPRRDILFSITKERENAIKSTINIDADKRIALYAPTFRSGQTNLSLYSVAWDAVRESFSEKFGGEWIVLVRLHPNISTMSAEMDFTDNVIDVTNFPDMQELLAISDACISDYSSSVFEFAVTGKPGFILAKDYPQYKKERDVLFDLNDTFLPFAESDAELIERIREFDAEKYAEKLNSFLYDQIGYFKEGNASEYIGKVILTECSQKR